MKNKWLVEIDGDHKAYKLQDDAQFIRLFEKLAAASEELMMSWLLKSGIVKPGMTKREILEAASAAAKEVAFVPDIRVERDLVSMGILHVTVGGRMVKIAPQAEAKKKPHVPCDRCGDSGEDFGYDDMGTYAPKACKCPAGAKFKLAGSSAPPPSVL